MKKFLVFFASLVFIHVTLFAQNGAETEIRKLEQLEIESIHKGDTATLLRLWDKKFVVNNPYGIIVTVPEIMAFIRKGEIDYSTVDRIVERVTFNDNIAISMGREVVKPQNNTPNAGKTITMRYTHTWIKTGGVWHLTARQATNFLVE